MRHVRVISRHKDVVTNMDTTYWGRNFGLLVIKDAFRNKILWYKFVHHESVADYVKGVGWLRENGFVIHGIFCDGIRGLLQSTNAIPRPNVPVPPDDDCTQIPHHQSGTACSTGTA